MLMMYFYHTPKPNGKKPIQVPKIIIFKMLPNSVVL